MEHPLVDQEGHPNQHKNNQKLCDETEDHPQSLKKCQWNLRQQHEQNLPMENKLLQNKFQGLRVDKNLKEQGCENH